MPLDTRIKIAKKATTILMQSVVKKNGFYPTKTALDTAFKTLLTDIDDPMAKEGLQLFSIPALYSGKRRDAEVHFRLDAYIPWENPTTHAFEPIPCFVGVSRWDYDSPDQGRPELLASGECWASRDSMKKLQAELAGNGITHVKEHGKWKQIVSP